MKILARKIQHCLVCIVLVFVTTNVFGQFIPHHTDHEDIYNYLSELRILGVVDYNPAVKPLSRKAIAEMLVKADTSARLNSIQKKELNFWFQEFGKEIGYGNVRKKDKFFQRREYEEMPIKKRLDLFYFSSKQFQLTLNPIISGFGSVSMGRDLRRYQWWGGEMFGRIGKNFGFYFSARDYLEQPNFNSNPFLSPNIGGVYRRTAPGSNAIGFYELRGGITYDWKWGQIGIVKDHLQLGSAPETSVILTDRAPSFPRIHLQLKPIRWAELTYTLGWLNSSLVDSSRSYITGNGAYRQVFHRKFIAANMITIRPWKVLSISVGSSVIIADNNLNVGHFIPIMFYTALDQSFNGQNNNAGQNSQIYGDISWDVFTWGQLYASVLVDEIQISTIFDSEKQRNAVSWQVGASTRPLTKANLKFYGSYTRTRPGVYGHYIPTTTYSHAGYGLGHFLGENSDQMIAGIQLRPIAKMRIVLEWQRWRKGPEHVYGNNANNLSGAQFLQQTLSSSDRVGIRVRYQVINDVIFQLSADYTKGSSDGVYPFPEVQTKNVSEVWFGLGIQIGM